MRAYHVGKGLREPVSLTIASRLPAKIPPRRTAYRNNCRTGKKNVFPNPSFEQETLPGKADYYFGDGAVIAPDQPGKFGEKCLKLLNDRKRGYAQMYWYCTPRHEKPTAYVWSFWAKGAKGGEKLWIRNTPKEATITVTPEWQRYHLAIAVPPRAETLSFWIRLSRRGAVWLDAVQLEEGYEPTEFEE